MMKVAYSERFLKSAQKLPVKEQNKLGKLLERLTENPFGPKLHTKHLTGRLSGLYSFRITRDWRVIFRFLSQTEVFLIDVAHRKDIYIYR